MATSSNALREQARQLYVDSDVAVEEIAQRIGRTSRTIRTWARQDGWTRRGGGGREQRPRRAGPSNETQATLRPRPQRRTKALLDNSARPSGALVYTSGVQLTADQFTRLKSELETSFQGARNAGRPLLLEGGLDWKAMSMSPRDMDFMEAKHAAAREIALAIGVPPMLLGIPGDNTYANMAEAQRSFWRQTVVPLVGRAARAFGGWLAPIMHQC